MADQPDRPDENAAADTVIAESALHGASAQHNENAQGQQQQQQNGDNNGHTDTTNAVVTAALSQSRNPSGKQTDEQIELALVALVGQGKTVRESSEILSINLRTAYNILGRNEENLDLLRSATRKLLITGALDRVHDWRIASEVGARKKGNHAPARDWLLHAGVIDSVEADRVGVRIAINIGTDDRPMRVVSPQSQQTDEDEH